MILQSNSSYDNITEPEILDNDDSCCSKLSCSKPTTNCGIAFVCSLVGIGIIVVSSILFIQTSNTTHLNQFLHLSDFHLDTYYDSKISVKDCRCHWKPGHENCTPQNSTTASGLYGSFGCDSPPSLVHSALAAAVKFSKSYSKQILPTIVTGDYTRHSTHFYTNPSQIVYDAFKNISWWMKDLGFESVVSTWGNDDFSENYYFDAKRTCNNQTNDHLKPNAETLLELTSNELMRNLPNKKMTINMKCYGYYSYDIYPGIRILSLNTIIYSVKHQPKHLTNEDPTGQFQWLRSQLDQCIKEEECHAIYIVGHIPPGREWCNAAPSWDNIYVEQYVSILSKYSTIKNNDVGGGGIIKGQLFGHEHINSIRLIDSNNLNIPPIIIAGAVSPVYGNRPSFRIVDYVRDRIHFGSITNIHVYGMKLKGDSATSSSISPSTSSIGTNSEWNERFSMVNEFNLQDNNNNNVLSSESILNLFNSFKYNEKTDTMNQPFQTFVTRSWDRNTKVPPDGSPCISHPNVCHLKHVLESDIEKCMAKGGI
jgi:hypothetical protein